jgi:hypothetical protein
MAENLKPQFDYAARQKRFEEALARIERGQREWIHEIAEENRRSLGLPSRDLE